VEPDGSIFLLTIRVTTVLYLAVSDASFNHATERHVGGKCSVYGDKVTFHKQIDRG
jgi:hypothetical protein